MASSAMSEETSDNPDCCIFPFMEHSHFTCYKEILNASERKKDTKDLKSLLAAAVGNSQYESKQNHDKKNTKFMQALYPNAKLEAYHWPWAFEYLNPDKSSEVVSRMCEEDNEPSEQQSNRMGEDAEERVFRMFRVMLKGKKIPSFLVHNYKWRTESYVWELDKVGEENVFDEGKWEIMKTKGQADFLISLPHEGCLLSIEVKGRDIKSINITGDIEESFGQCEKALTFISILNNDLFYNKNIPFIKVAAVPNSSRDDLPTELICGICLKHIITGDELSDPEKVYKWFSDLMKDLHSNQTNSDFHGDLHEKMIGRLLRPVSRENKTCKLLTTFNQITQKHGTFEEVHSRWIQFNREQADVLMDGHKRLWITGVPGSGKTLLLWKQIEKLLKGHPKVNNVKGTFKVIAFPGNENDFLYDRYIQELSQESHLVIERFYRCKLDPVGEYSANTCNILPQIIKDFQKKYEVGILHMFIDEATFLLKGTKSDKLKRDWNNLDLKRLGYLWVVQNPQSTDDESGESLEQTLTELDFKKVHLEYVMRMSKENVHFVRHVLNRPELISGQGVAGLLPMLYRMACVCTPSKGSVYCEKCIHKRQAALIVKILKDLKVRMKRTKRGAVLISDIVILMNDDHKFVVDKILSKYSSKYPDRPYKDVKNTSISVYRGCEEKIVILDLSESFLEVENLLESMSRCVSRLVLLDAGSVFKELSSNDDNALRTSKDVKMEHNVKLKISDAAKEGLVDIKNIGKEHFDEEELKVILNSTHHKTKYNICGVLGVMGVLTIIAILLIKYS